MLTGHNSNIDLAFYNDRVKEIIAADLIAEPFTFVPIKAGHMELVGGNAVVFGKITEGYDAISLDVSTEIVYEDVSLANPIYNLNVPKIQYGATLMQYYDPLVSLAPISKQDWDNAGFSYGGSYDDRTSWRILDAVLHIVIPVDITVNSTYAISIQNEEEHINITVSYTAVGGDTYAEVKAALEGLLTGAGAEVVDPGLGGNVIQIYKRLGKFMDFPTPDTSGVDYILRNFDARAYVLTLGLTVKYPQLKCGAVQGFGFVYKDRAGRTCPVIKTDALAVYIPFYSGEITDVGNGMGTILNLIFKINHTPPSWAESYEIVYFGNISMDYFLQIRANNITLIPNSNGNRFSININETLAHAWTLNNRWKVDTWIWLPGDRLRLVGTIDDVTGYGAAIGGNYVYDYEIEATGTQYNEEAIGGDWLIVQAVKRPTPFAGATNIIVEVYRPRKGIGQTITAYYGTGMVFDIGIDANGDRYHKGDVDQSIINNTPAEVHNTIVDPKDPTGNSRITRAYDCWKFFRLNYKQTELTQTGIIQPFWAESIFPSDWWKEQDINRKLTSMGFPFLDDISQKQTELDERFRFGGSLISGTRTNNIAHFTYANFRDLQKKDGDITGLREVGFTLKAIQMYKETSVYINRIQTFNPDGTSQYVLTDSFIGDMRPMDTGYGCQHSDGIIVNGRNVYYWDNSQGAFIRSSPNGQEVLDIKMKRWFKDLAQWVKTNGGKDALQVRIGANNEFDEIWITFRMGEQIQGIIFSEKQGRFISRINQITETYIHLGNFFAHLYQQRLWIMNVNEGQDYLNWAGVPTFAEIEVVSNMNPEQNKVYNAVALFSDHELSSLPKYVYIPQEASAGGSLMETNIPLWERREGVFFGEIMKDENSKGNFLNIYDKKMNGNAMRGRYCFVKLMTDNHDEKVRVDSIVVFSTPSERNI